MDIELITSIIKYLVTVLVGVLLGNGAVYMFNHMPGRWFMDYDESLPEEVDTSGDKEEKTKTDVFGAAGAESLRNWWPGMPQRVRSTPWKYLFSMLFIAVGLYLVRDDWSYAASVVLAVWILLELAIADIKYRIVPDQLLILLAVSAVGFIQYHTGWQDMLAGAALGIGIMGATAILGRAIYKRDAVGGGDIKLLAVLGLLLGTKGVLTVFMLSALISGAHMVILLAARRIKRNDSVPMVPYLAASAAIYLIFIWPHIDAILMYLL